MTKDSVKDLTPKDEGYIENDMEKILDRLRYDYVAYLQIHSTINFPLLLKKDVVALRRAEHYRVKDIVLYQVDDYYFLRRIIAVEDNRFYVCGDNEFEVRIIHPKMVLARAISRERGKHRLSLVLMNKKRLYSLAIIRKGKLRMKKHLMYDDQNTLTNAYQAISSKASEDQMIIQKPIMPLDSRLKIQLSVFKSPEERLKEYHLNLIKNEETKEEDLLERDEITDNEPIEAEPIEEDFIDDQPIEENFIEDDNVNDGLTESTKEPFDS